MIIDDVIAGLIILKKYDNNIAAEHDVIYACPRAGENIPEADQLKKLGWFWSEETDSWGYFV